MDFYTVSYLLNDPEFLHRGDKYYEEDRCVATKAREAIWRKKDDSYNESVPGGSNQNASSEPAEICDQRSFQVREAEFNDWLVMSSEEHTSTNKLETAKTSPFLSQPFKEISHKEKTITISAISKDVADNAADISDVTSNDAISDEFLYLFETTNVAGLYRSLSESNLLTSSLEYCNDNASNEQASSPVPCLRPTKCSTSRLSRSLNDQSSLQLCRRVSFADHHGYPLAKHCPFFCNTTDKQHTLIRRHPPVLRHPACGTLPEEENSCAAVVIPEPDADTLQQRLMKNHVTLRYVTLEDGEVCGVARARNLPYHRNVIVRCTTDDWSTSFNVSTTHLPCEEGYRPYHDYGFCVAVPHGCTLLKFDLVFQVEKKRYYDNNNKEYYQVKL